MFLYIPFRQIGLLYIHRISETSQFHKGARNGANSKPVGI